MSLRRVGILGGMGPEATVLLMSKVIAAVPASDDADHIPLIVDQNPQVPSRIRYLLEGGDEDPGPVLAAMARRLEGAGADALAMPCNTAHHFAPAIRAASSVPFLDMVRASVEHAAALSPAGGRVGILASPAVQQIALFDAPLRAAGLEPVFPRNQAPLLEAIRSIKSCGPNPAARETLKAASSALASAGATVQLVACTEFSLIADAVSAEADGFDTLDVLAQRIVEFARRAMTSGVAAAQ